MTKCPLYDRTVSAQELLSGSVIRSPYLSFHFPLTLPYQGHFPLPRPFKAQSATPQGDGPVGSTPRCFLCSPIYTLMLDNVIPAFAIYLPTGLSFFLWNIPPISCLPGTDCYYFFFRLINQSNRIKTSECIHHIISATFTTVANTNKY